MSATSVRYTSARRLRSVAGRLLLRLQGSRRYRRLAGALAGDCTVRCATAGERSRLAETRPETGHPQSGPQADVVAYVGVRRERIKAVDRRPSGARGPAPAHLAHCLGSTAACAFARPA